MQAIRSIQHLAQIQPSDCIAQLIYASKPLHRANLIARLQKALRLRKSTSFSRSSGSCSKTGRLTRGSGSSGGISFLGAKAIT